MATRIARKRNEAFRRTERRSSVSVVKMASAMLVGCVVAVSRPAHGNINLELRPGAPTTVVSTVFSVDLYAVSDSASTQLMIASQAIISWDTAFVQFVGLDNTSTPLNSSFIGAEPYGLNTSTTDGDFMWVGLAAPLSPLGATPGGLFLTSFDFQALAPTGILPTLINIVPTAGMSPSGNPGQSVVLDGTTPNLNVTGTLTGSAVTIVPAPGCAALVMLALVGGRRRSGR